MLNFKVIIQVIDGVVKPVDKARGDNNCIKKVIDSVSKYINDDKKSLAIAHSNCIEKAEKIKEIMKDKYDFKNITISEVGSVMGTYTSKGAILISIL